MLFKETLSLMLYTALAWHLTVGGSRALDLGRATLETSNLGALLSFGTSGAVNEYTGFLVLFGIRNLRDGRLR